mmetsp:Transcript_54238/g.141789  ORF Transcript_54238/g.141789 Transcript_54238/m.141789 type:complete len:244 (-) Transcript_54238:1709-2440(-)
MLCSSSSLAMFTRRATETGLGPGRATTPEPLRERCPQGTCRGRPPPLPLPPQFSGRRICAPRPNSWKHSILKTCPSSSLSSRPAPPSQPAGRRLCDNSRVSAGESNRPRWAPATSEATARAVPKACNPGIFALAASPVRANNERSSRCSRPQISRAARAGAEPASSYKKPPSFENMNESSSKPIDVIALAGSATSRASVASGGNVRWRSFVGKAAASSSHTSCNSRPAKWRQTEAHKYPKDPE